MQLIKQSTATTLYVGPVLDSAGAAVTTAGPSDFRLIKNGTAATLTGASVTHDVNGHYTIALTTTNTNTLGRLTIASGNTSHAMSTHRYSVLLASVFDAIIASGTLSTFNPTIDSVGLLPDQQVNTTAVGGIPVSSPDDLKADTSGLATISEFEVLNTNLITWLFAPLSVNVSQVGGSVVSGPNDLKADISGLATTSQLDARTLPSADYFNPTTDSVTVGTNNDKAGYALTPNTGLGNQTTNITGNLSGSVGSVTGAVGSVTGQVTVGTNNDKTNYELSASERTTLAALIDATLLDAGDATDLIASIVTRIGNTNVDEASFVAAIKAALFDAGSAANKLSVNASGQVQSSNMRGTDNALLASGYTAPANADIALILADTSELQTAWADGGRLDTILDARASQTSVDTVDGIVDAILVDTGTTLQAELDGIQADTEDIQSRLPAALVSGRIDSSVGAMAANTLTASALSTDAVTEIQSGLATSTALATVDTVVDAILADTGTDGVVVASGSKTGYSLATPPPTVGDIRTELATELGRIDVAISSVSTGGISAEDIADAVRTELETELAFIDIAISSRSEFDASIDLVALQPDQAVNAVAFNGAPIIISGDTNSGVTISDSSIASADQVSTAANLVIANLGDEIPALVAMYDQRDQDSTPGTIGWYFKKLRQASNTVEAVVTNDITPTATTFSVALTTYPTGAFRHAVLAVVEDGAILDQNSPILTFINNTTYSTIVLEEAFTQAPTEGDVMLINVVSHVHSVASVAAGVWGATSAAYSAATGTFGYFVNAMSTMIEFVGSVWRFKATAVSQSPATDVETALTEYGVSTSTEVQAVGTSVGEVETAVDGISAKFAGITFVRNWIALILGKTADASTLAEVNETTAANNYTNVTDSQEAIRDRGDAAWTGSGGGGGGGGGDATLAKQDEILATLQASRVLTVASPNVKGDLVLVQGDTYDGIGNPKAQWVVTTDYTVGWTVTFTIRDENDVVIYTAPGTVASAVLVTVAMTAPTGLSMGSSNPRVWKGKFDVQLTKGDEPNRSVKTIALGSVYINEDVTRE